jgi:hypothetical protein
MFGITQESFYGSRAATASDAQLEVALSPGRQSAPAVQSTVSLASAHAVTISWVGIMVALIVLRVLYEVSE